MERILPSMGFRSTRRTLCSRDGIKCVALSDHGEPIIMTTISPLNLKPSSLRLMQRQLLKQECRSCQELIHSLCWIVFISWCLWWEGTIWLFLFWSVCFACCLFLSFPQPQGLRARIINRLISAMRVPCRFGSPNWPTIACGWILCDRWGPGFYN